MFSRISARYFSINVAVVGSGPAGFYTTQKLVRHPDIKVDIFERLPVPFGLVRYGVAPDHPEVKNVINTFTNVANSDKVNFYGNVSLGSDIQLDDLMNAYHAVVLAYGSAQDRMLNIEGEKTSKNTISARNFVGWYNGVPEDKDLDINLDCDTACIVGQGNVALDCARILLNPVNLDKTDITTYAQHRLSKSRIKRIYIVGRRGPVQVAFTIKELRELINLTQGNARLEPATIFTDHDFSQTKVRDLSRQRRRLTELLVNLSTVKTKDLANFNGIECVFKFLSNPHRIIADEATKEVTGLKIQRSKFEKTDDFMDEHAKPVNVEDEYEKIDCGLIIRSIGYKAVMVDKSLPINDRLGAIANDNGRVHGYRNLYCSGWLSTGAVGVIAGTLNSSQITAQSILDDIQSKSLPGVNYEKPGYKLIGRQLSRKSIQVVHFNDWLRINELEKRLGEMLGKSREKFVDVVKMLEVAKSPTE